MKKVLTFVAAAILVACQGPSGQDGNSGASRNALEGIRLQMIEDLGLDDVTAVKFEVTAPGGLVVSDCVSLEDETLPGVFLPEGSGDEHRFADRFFVLAPGEYNVTATPMISCDPEAASVWCVQTTATATVVSNQTTEIVLVSRCDMTDSGALDIVTALEHDPVIEYFLYDNSKFVMTCEDLSLRVTASDQDGDALTYEWEMTGEPGAQFDFTSNGNSANFRSATAGTYSGTVRVCDNLEMCAWLTFPIYVQMGTDINGNGLGDECDGFAVTWTLDYEFESGQLINVDANDDQVALDQTTQAFNFVWVAVSSRGTAVKINTATGAILGEYRTAPEGYATNPSRTTVDNDGNVWISNRDECSGNQGSIVKIGLLENNGCVDRNGNGVIDTSAGLGDVRAWGGTTPATAADECILLFVRTTSCGTRHLSVDASNNLWVSGISGSNQRAFDYINGATGIITRTEASNGYGGYGGLIAPDGSIWSSNPLTHIINPSLPFSSAGNRQNWVHDSYGLCVNSMNGEVWNTSLNGNQIRRFAPDGTLLGTYSHGNYYAQGCVVDGNGHVWVAHSILGNTRTVGHLLPDGTWVGNVTLGNGSQVVGATGVAVDGNGMVWATGYYTGIVYRINPALGPHGPDGITHVGLVDMTSTPGGNLYNYSDMTGSTLIGAPGVGSWTVQYDSLEAGTVWDGVSWTADQPGDSSITVTVSSSGDGVTWSAPVPVTNGGDPGLTGRYLRVTVSFQRASSGETPVLYDLSVHGN